MLAKLIWRILANGLGLWIASRLLDGVDYGNDPWVLVVAALIFSLINMVIKPIVVILSLPAIVLTLGLFMLIINGLMLYLVTAIYPQFQIASFGAAMLTVIIMWLVNFALSMLTEKSSAHA